MPSAAPSKNITSFAMREDSSTYSGSPNSANVGDILAPKKMDEVMKILASPAYSNIKYSAYRTASKMDFLRSAICMNEVKLGAVTAVFNQHGYGQQHGGPGPTLGSSFACLDVVIDRQKAADITADLFFSANKVRTYYMPALDVQACAETALQTAMTIYGVKSTSSVIPAKALKVFFVILSEGKLVDKLSYLFGDFANLRTKLLSRRSLSALLRLLCRFPEFLQESNNFGSFLVEAATAQCFEMVARTSNTKFALSEEQFKAWMYKEPQVAVWLATFYRLASSKAVRHGVSCVACKASDIVGLRYQCLLCINYDVCQQCFFFGKTSRSHKLTHPIQEYCTRSTRKDATRALVKLLRNKLKRKRRRKAPAVRYLPHNADFRNDALPEESSDPSTASDDDDVVLDVRGRGDQAKLFNSIVLHLEEQNQKMMTKLQGTNEERSCAVMQQHLAKLRQLIDNVFVAAAAEDHETSALTLNGPSLIESTPLPQPPALKPLKQQKLLSRIHLDKHFSPVVFKVPKDVPAPRRQQDEVDEMFRSDSIIVDTLLDQHSDGDNDEDPSELSLQDLTSLLVKTGFKFEDTNEVSNRLLVTSGEDEASAMQADEENLAEEIESLMLRLESVFKSYHDKTVVSVHQKQTQKEFGNSGELQHVVAEISDQVHAFNAALHRLPSVRSEGDGLSSPEPPSSVAALNP